MKFTLMRRRFTVSAPRMAVKAHLPWPLRILGSAVILGIAAAVAIWTYELGSQLAGFNKDALKTELAALRKQVADLSAERNTLSRAVNGVETQRLMDHGVQQQLSTLIKALEAENTQLKEENSFFESLLPNAAQDGTLAIRNLRANIDLPNNALHYRLLVMQGGKSTADFEGALQLIVMGTHKGKTYSITFPEKTDLDPRWSVNFKRYQRLEGSLQLPEAMVVKSLEVRVLRQGEQRARQSITLS